MKIIFLFTVSLMIAEAATAQEEPMYSQYMFNMLAINPAYAGTHGTAEATALFRKQWLGIPGSPSTATFGADLPDNLNGLGFGFQMINDQIGIEKTNGIAASFSYRTHITKEKDELSFGLLASISNFQANFNLVNLIDNPDPNFTGQVINAWLPNVGAGIFYHTDKFYIGLSAPSLLTNKINGNTISTGASASSDVLISHYFLTSGVVLTLNDDLKLKPSFLLKAVPGSPIQIDLNANLWIKDIVCAGFSYRFGAAVIGMLELQLSPKFRFGYSYDKEFSNLSKFSIGTHEVLLKYELRSEEAKKYYYPRYF